MENILMFKTFLGFFCVIAHLSCGTQADKSAQACWEGDTHLTFLCPTEEGPIYIVSGFWGVVADGIICVNQTVDCVENMAVSDLQRFNVCDGEYTCDIVMTQYPGECPTNYQAVFYNCGSSSSPVVSGTGSTTATGTTILATVTDNNPSEALPLGVIIGAAVGAIGFVIILIIIVFFLRKRRKKKPDKYDSPKPQEEEGKNNYDTLSDFTSDPRSGSKEVKTQDLSCDPTLLYSVPEKTLAKKNAAIRHQEFLAHTQPGTDDNAYGEAWEMGSGRTGQGSGHTGQSSGHTGQGDSEDGPDYDYVRGPEDILQDRTSDDYDTIGGRDDHYSDIGSPVKDVEDKPDGHQPSASDDEEDFTTMAENTIYT